MVSIVKKEEEHCLPVILGEMEVKLQQKHLSTGILQTALFIKLE